MPHPKGFHCKFFRLSMLVKHNTTRPTVCQGSMSTSKGPSLLSTQVTVVFLSQTESLTSKHELQLRHISRTVSLKTWLLHLRFKTARLCFKFHFISFSASSPTAEIFFTQCGFQNICFPSHFILSLPLKITFPVFPFLKKVGGGSSLLLRETIIFTIHIIVLSYSGSDRILEGLSMRQPGGSHYRESSCLDGQMSSAGVSLGQNGSGCWWLPLEQQTQLLA